MNVSVGELYIIYYCNLHIVIEKMLKLCRYRLNICNISIVWENCLALHCLYEREPENEFNHKNIEPGLHSGYLYVKITCWL